MRDTWLETAREERKEDKVSRGSSQRVERKRQSEEKREEILLILILSVGVESRNSGGGTADSLCRLFTKKTIKIRWYVFSLQLDEARCFPGDHSVSVSLPAGVVRKNQVAALHPFYGTKINFHWVTMIHDGKHEFLMWLGQTPFILLVLVWFHIPAASILNPSKRCRFINFSSHVRIL